MTRRINGDALENRDGTAATGDVFVFDDAHADGGEWEAPGAGSASAAWPVGSVYENVLVATNPAILLGFGTWVALGAGRVLVGFDAGDADFDTVGETGGAKTKAISAHAGTAVDAHSGTAVDAHSGTAVTAHAATLLEHQHGAGTLVPSAHAGATVGNHTVADQAHYHAIDSTGLATISAHAQHRHEFIKANLPAHAHGILAANLAHTHPQGIRNTGTAGAAGSQGSNTANNATAGTTGSGGPATTATEVEGNAGACYTEYTTQGAHTLGGSTQSDGAPILTHSVGQASAHTMSGLTASGTIAGDLTHAVTQPSAHAVTQPSNHAVTQPSAHADLNVVQPYIVVHRWYRSA